MIAKRVIFLDGIDSGFVIMHLDDESGKWKLDGNIFREKFSTLQLAKSYLRTTKGAYDSNKYSFAIISECMRTISGYLIPTPWWHLHEVEGHYEYYDQQGNLYWFVPEEHPVLIKAGYIVFGDGDKIEVNPEGVKLSRKYMDSIIKVVKNEMCTNPEANIAGYKSDANWNNMVYFKDSTYRLNLYYSYQLMCINQKRKAESKRCIPFIKGLDRYKTIYTCITKDAEESKPYLNNSVPESVISRQHDQSVNADVVLETIVDRLHDQFPELNVRFMEVQLKHGCLFLNY